MEKIVRRTVPVILLLAAIVALVGVPADLVSADSGSISRDAKGAQPTGLYDALGGPPTPRVYGLGQNFLFVSGVVLLIVAALLGAYTLARARPHDRH
jgi:hypothetical protein